MFVMMMIKVMVTRMMVDDDGDFLAMMWTMTFFGFFKCFYNRFTPKKYLHNTALYMFPFASDTSV